MPRSRNQRIVAGGADEPPTMIVCSLPSSAPVSLDMVDHASHTVGTPAEWVTPSSLNRRHMPLGLVVGAEHQLAAR